MGAVARCAAPLPGAQQSGGRLESESKQNGQIPFLRLWPYFPSQSRTAIERLKKNTPVSTLPINSYVLNTISFSASLPSAFLYNFSTYMVYFWLPTAPFAVGGGPRGRTGAPARGSTGGAPRRSARSGGSCRWPRDAAPRRGRGHPLRAPRTNVLMSKHGHNTMACMEKKNNHGEDTIHDPTHFHATSTYWTHCLRHSLRVTFFTCPTNQCLDEQSRGVTRWPLYAHTRTHLHSPRFTPSSFYLTSAVKHTSGAPRCDPTVLGSVLHQKPSGPPPHATLPCALKQCRSWPKKKNTHGENTIHDPRVPPTSNPIPIFAPTSMHHPHTGDAPPPIARNLLSLPSTHLLNILTTSWLVPPRTNCCTNSPPLYVYLACPSEAMPRAHARLCSLATTRTSTQHRQPDTPRPDPKVAWQRPDVRLLWSSQSNSNQRVCGKVGAGPPLKVLKRTSVPSIVGWFLIRENVFIHF